MIPFYATHNEVNLVRANHQNKVFRKFQYNYFTLKNLLFRNSLRGGYSDS